MFDELFLSRNMLLRLLRMNVLGDLTFMLLMLSWVCYGSFNIKDGQSTSDVMFAMFPVPSDKTATLAPSTTSLSKRLARQG